MSLAITAASVENDNNFIESTYNKNIIEDKRRHSNTNAKTQKYRSPEFNMEKVKSVINSLHNNISDDNELADFTPNSISNTNGNKITSPTIEKFTALNPLEPPQSMRQLESETYDTNVPQPMQNDDADLQDLNKAFLNDAQVRDYYKKLVPGSHNQNQMLDNQMQNQTQNQNQNQNRNRYSNILETGSTNDVLLNKLNYIINLLEEQQDEKTNNVTEEVVLYSFLGVFIIFVVDSFARVGKYIR